MAAFAASELLDCAVAGSLASPILGGDGQREFLLALGVRSAQPEESPFAGPFYGEGVKDEAARGNSRQDAADEPASVGALEPVTMRRPETAHARKLKRAAAKRREKQS